MGRSVTKNSTWDRLRRWTQANIANNGGSPICHVDSLAQAGQFALRRQTFNEFGQPLALVAACVFAFGNEVAADRHMGHRCRCLLGTGGAVGGIPGRDVGGLGKVGNA